MRFKFAVEDLHNGPIHDWVSLSFRGEASPSAVPGICEEWASLLKGRSRAKGRGEALPCSMEARWMVLVHCTCPPPDPGTPPGEDGVGAKIHPSCLGGISHLLSGRKCGRKDRA